MNRVFQKGNLFILWVGAFGLGCSGSPKSKKFIYKTEQVSKQTPLKARLVIEPSRLEVVTGDSVKVTIRNIGEGEHIRKINYTSPDLLMNNVDVIYYQVSNTPQTLTTKETLQPKVEVKVPSGGVVATFMIDTSGKWLRADSHARVGVSRIANPKPGMLPSGLYNLSWQDGRKRVKGVLHVTSSSSSNGH